MQRGRGRRQNRGRLLLFISVLIILNVRDDNAPFQEHVFQLTLNLRHVLPGLKHFLLLYRLLRAHHRDRPEPNTPRVRHPVAEDNTARFFFFLQLSRSRRRVSCDIRSARGYESFPCGKGFGKEGVHQCSFGVKRRIAKPPVFGPSRCRTWPRDVASERSQSPDNCYTRARPPILGLWSTVHSVYPVVWLRFSTQPPRRFG